MTAQREGVAIAAAGMALIGASYGLARFAYGLFVPQFRSAFDMTLAQAGAISSASYLAYCLGIVAASVASPRLGQPRRGDRRGAAGEDGHRDGRGRRRRARGATSGAVAAAVGMRPAWTATVLALAASTAAAPLVAASPPLAVAALAVFGAAYIAVTGLLLIWGIQVYAGQPAAGTGVAFLMLAVGQTVGAAARSALAGTTSLAAAFVVAALFALACVVLAPASVARTERSAAA